jgi:hypothetical protein
MVGVDAGIGTSVAAHKPQIHVDGLPEFGGCGSLAPATIVLVLVPNDSVPTIPATSALIWPSGVRA